MEFHFDIDKSIASSAYLILKNNGSYDMLHLVKALYCANRICLIRYGRTITGDSLCSMENGPAVSETYNLIKGDKRADPEHLKKWRAYISERDVNTVHLKPGQLPSFGVLSGREVQLLDSSFEIISKVKTSLKKWSHKVFPEWEDVGKSSKPIDPKTILRLEKIGENEILEVEEEIAELNWLRA
jgi:hypothetical protein